MAKILTIEIKKNSQNFNVNISKVIHKVWWEKMVRKEISLDQENC